MVAEMILMINALPYLKSQQLNSIALPNSLNFGFDYHLFIQVCLWSTLGLACDQKVFLGLHMLIRLKAQLLILSVGIVQ